MSSFRRSLIINFLASSGATIAQFVIAVIVARILTPSEIGIYSIAVVLVNIAHVFRDFGVSTYLQREDDLTTGKVRSAMGVAYAISWFIAACIFLGSGWVARYFGYAAIEPVMHILAISFLFLPLSSVVLALLLREYNATKIGWATFWGTFAYAVTCLGLATSGFGALSLAWANLANIVATGLAFMWLRPATMSYLPRFREVGGILKFGTGALFANLIKAGNDALPDLILGKMGTARQVGLVSRANSTVNIFLYVAGSAMTFGSQTYLAQAHHAKQSLEPLLQRSTLLVTGLGWPVLAVTSVAARDIIVGLYGDSWIDAAPAVPPLALMAAIRLMFYYNTTAFNAVGRPYLAAVPLAVTALCRILFTVLLFSGDIMSFAWALAGATFVTMPFSFLMQRKYLQCSVRSYIRALIPSAIISAICAGVAILVLTLIDKAGIGSALIRVFILAFPVTLAWIMSLKLLAHPLYGEIMQIAGKTRLFKHQADTDHATG